MNPTVNRKYKDSLFRMLFGTEENKENLLSLYNAINHTSYTSTGDMRITTLQDVIYMTIKNDVSCIIDDNLSLLEHQSTFCPNMPVRGLVYFGNLYSAIIERSVHSIYSSHLVKLPTPQYYVFYNGTADRPDREILKLSDAFQNPVQCGTFEWTATVININKDHNPELMKACRVLNEYSTFISMIREYQATTNDIVSAIDQAINQAIQEGILADFLKTHLAEVKHMFLTSFDEEKYRRTLKEEGREEGRVEGREEGRAEGREEGKAEGRQEGIVEGQSMLLNAIQMIRKGATPEQMLADGIPQQTINMALEAL